MFLERGRSTRQIGIVHGIFQIPLKAHQSVGKKTKVEPGDLVAPPDSGLTDSGNKPKKLPQTGRKPQVWSALATKLQHMREIKLQKRSWFVSQTQSGKQSVRKKLFGTQRPKDKTELENTQTTKQPGKPYGLSICELDDIQRSRVIRE